MVDRSSRVVSSSFLVAISFGDVQCSRICSAVASGAWHSGHAGVASFLSMCDLCGVCATELTSLTKNLLMLVGVPLTL
mgnify:CR=1 FL=1